MLDEKFMERLAEAVKVCKPPHYFDLDQERLNEDMACMVVVAVLIDEGYIATDNDEVLWEKLESNIKRTDLYQEILSYIEKEIEQC